ncbi:MAG: hypothetical protein J5761_06830 [Paludibacteraceae bacterium]|nr:hypothetical protein [Paludibacteraceae bacterium]
MKRSYSLIALILWGSTTLMAQQSDPLATGLGGVATIAGETQAPDFVSDNVTADSAAATVALEPVPVWKQKLYYGYNFDIYYHHDSRSQRKENGFSISIEPEIGWKLKERVYLGLRVGGSYQNTMATYTVEDITPAGLDTMYSTDLRVHQGSWSVTPYVRYRLKSMFNDKLGIWLEAHLYAGMEFPSVDATAAKGTDYDGLRHSISYGAQISPVITYKFNRKSTFQIFFSILSLGYSGTTFCYSDPTQGNYNEYTNDVIIFSGKLKNLIANQFTPGLYGLKFGVQKSF